MRILIIRIGAFGDALIVTPLVRHLASKGHEIVFLGSEQSEQVLRENPHVSKFVLHERDSIANDKLGEYFDRVRVEHGCDKLIDLCESIEVRLALCRDYPQWNWPKAERRAYADINYYEFAFEMAAKQHPDLFEDLSWRTTEYTAPAESFFTPEMFFSQGELDWVMEERKKNFGKTVIMWGLSGSGRQKTYPYVPYIVADLVRKHKNLKVILVGGHTCQILECAFPKNAQIVKRSGDYSFRQSALLAKHVDLVVSPDTGFLHAAGCWSTPKIGLLTHTSRENITKHFENDFSIESEAPCAPCFRLIQDAEKECPIEDGVARPTLCMGKDGMRPERVFERIEEALCPSLKR